MKKYFLSIILVFVISFTLSNQVFAEDNSYVKVALKSPLKSNHTVNLSSDGYQVGVWEDGFSTLFYIYEDKLTATTTTYGPFHIMTNKVFDAYDEAYKEIGKLRSLDIDAFIYYDHGAYEIWIGQYISESIAAKEAIKYSDQLNSINNIIQHDKNRIILLNENDEIVLVFNKDQGIHFSSLHINDGGMIKVEENNYRGFISFSRSENELILINNVSLQHYLYGVVPKETYPSWPIEALKAQAMAAKNYALLNINKHSHEGFGLCDTTHCQVYGGYNSETIMTNRAVDETIGKLLTYDNELVNTFYHSSSGGYTENIENIWSESFSYLRGVKDDFSLGSPYDLWQYAISEDEIRKKLFEKGMDIGHITEVEILSTFPSGRVEELMIRGTMGTALLKKDNIRQVLGTTNIKSTLFQVKFHGHDDFSSHDIYIYNLDNGNIEKQSVNGVSVLSDNGLTIIDGKDLSKGITVTDGLISHKITDIQNNNSLDAVGKYVFSGSGFGHGVGMSQWGAKTMAELGYDYIQILEHYYTGAIVE